MGARAAVKMCASAFSNTNPKKKEKITPPKTNMAMYSKILHVQKEMHLQMLDFPVPS